MKENNMGWIIALIIIGIVIFLLFIMAIMHAASAADEACMYNTEILSRKDDDDGVV
jgi:heme/copper-type cytochrome/quinol oxidase subunit 2